MHTLFSWKSRQTGKYKDFDSLSKRAPLPDKSSCFSKICICLPKELNNQRVNTSCQCSSVGGRWQIFLGWQYTCTSLWRYPLTINLRSKWVSLQKAKYCASSKKADLNADLCLHCPFLKTDFVDTMTGSRFEIWALS